MPRILLLLAGSWGVFVLVNFFSPGLLLSSLGCLPSFVSLLTSIKLDRLPLAGIALMPVLLVSLTGWGIVASRVLGVARPGILTTILLGAGSLGLAVLGAGWVGFYTGWMFAVAWAAGLAVAGIRWRDWFPELNPSGWARANWRIWTFRSVTGSFALLSFLEACPPEWFIDSLTYHLFLPGQFIVHGKAVQTPWLFPSGYAEVFRVLAGSLESAGGWGSVKLFYWASSMLAVLSVGELARSVWGKREAGCAAQALFVSLPLVAKLAGHGLTDLPATWGICLAASWLVRWRASGGGAKLALASASMGVAMSFKYSAFPFWGLFCLALVRDRRIGLRPLLIWTTAAWVILSPCLARSAAVWGNPLAPLFAKVIPTLGWDEGVVAVTDAETAVTGWAGSLGRRLASLWLSAGTEPDSLSSFYRFGKGDLGLLLLLALFTVYAGLAPGSPRWLVMANLLAVCVWMGWVQAFRYLIPMAALACIPISAPIRGKAVARGILVAVLLVHNWTLWPRVFGKNPGPWLSGTAPADLPVVRDPDEVGTLRWIRSLPEDSRTLLLWSYGAYPVGRQAILTQVWEEPLLVHWARESRDAGHLVRKIRQAGVTHVSLSLSTALRAPMGPFGAATRPAIWHKPEMFRELFSRHFRLAATRGNVLCYEFRGKGGSRAPEVFSSRPATDLGPSLEEAARLGSEGRIARAREVLISLAVPARSSPFNQARLAENWLAVGETGEALRLGQRALVGGFETARLRRTMAAACAVRGLKAEAARHLARARELDPDEVARVAAIYAFSVPFCGE